MRAINLITLKPVKGCAIQGYCLDSQKTVTDPIKTNDNGLVELNETDFADQAKTICPAGSVVATADASAATVFLGRLGKNVAYSGLSPISSENTENYRSYFYTDKPIYRLGQTVNYKAICRQWKRVL